MNGQEIAVIGLSGRFPEAADIHEFWDNLAKDRESIRFFSEQELLEAGIDKSVLSNPNYIKANGVLDNIEEFDAPFFDMNPREVYLMDVQHRVFLECAWQALESAAIDPQRTRCPIGVFASCGFATRSIDLFSQAKSKQNMSELYQVLIQNDKDFLATLTSYKLDLTGPSMTVQTACSSSAVAVHMACQSLLTGDSDIALAGGAKIFLPQISGYIYVPGMILSPDGHCRPFDANAKGIISSNGCGIVVLKRYAEAVQDGDNILAVILGSAINNDGHDKVGISAPSVNGQRQVILDALHVSEVEPQSISYVEAHGTGTLIGDPIEVQALTLAYREYTEDKQFCGLGSVKSNLGHLDAAAGVTGLIKAILALQHREIPATVNFTRANEKLNLPESPFYVIDKLTPWDRPEPLRAGVSSFGVGGTNVHMILEQAPKREQSAASGREHIIVLSAKSATSLDRTRDRLALFLNNHKTLSIDEVAHTLQTGRQELDHRFACVSDSIESAVASLQSAQAKDATSSGTVKPVAFLFPGQGAQYVNMGRALYDDFEVFRNALTECADLFQDISHVDLLPILFPASTQTDETSEQLLQTELAQPALFMIEYSLAKLWMSMGIQPDVMLGHSVGEITAACLADVISLEHAIYMITQRGRLLQSLPAGAMLAINRPINEIEPFLPENISIAAINTPNSVVVSGLEMDIESLRSKLSAKRIASIRVQTSHAFHSHMMDPILPEFKHYMARVRVHTDPRIPYFSSLTGDWISLADLEDKTYWSRHIRHTVQFSRALERLWQEMDPVFIEVGPGRVLSTFAENHSQKPESCMTVASLPHAKEKCPVSHHFMKSMGRLWQAGQPIEWSAMHAPAKRVMLPGIVFDKQRFEIEVSGFSFGTTPQQSDSLYYRPVWRRGLSRVKSDPTDHKAHQIILFTHDTQIPVGDLFDNVHADIYRVCPGERFGRRNNEFEIRPDQPGDYQELITRMDPSQPILVVHAWLYDSRQRPDGDPDVECLQRAAQMGFMSLVLFLQNSKSLEKTSVDILVLTNRVFDVLGNECLAPEKNSMIGAVLSANQEYPHVNCYLLDTDNDRIPVYPVLSEMQNNSHRMAAMRHRRLWFREYEPVQMQQGSLTIKSGQALLITGGTGMLGLLFAKAIAEQANVHLFLVARTKFPHQDEWHRMINDDQTDAKMKRKYQQLIEIQETGTRLTLVQADISKVDQVQQLRTTIEQMHGSVDGIIHCAGLVDPRFFRTLANMDTEILESHLSAKIIGLLNLAQVFEDADLDFCMLASSLSAILGGLGFAAYAGSNAILDALAWQKNRCNNNWISVNWDGWHSDNGHALDSRLNSTAITPAQGQQAVLDLLSHVPETQILVSPSDLQYRLKHWVQDEQDQDRMENKPQAHQRPAVSTHFVAPTGPIEIQLTEIFQDCLGFENIGIHDNFFELGGDSLLATQIAARIQSTLGVHVDLEHMFNDPTIAHLAGILSEQLLDDMDPDELSDLMDDIETGQDDKDESR